MKTSKIKHVAVAILIALLLIGLSSCKDNVPEPTQKHKYIDQPFVDYSFSVIPEFVNDSSEFLDIEKQYVLPDGYLYGYEQINVISVTNQLQMATDVDGSIFNECGYQDNTRIRDILELGTANFSFVTGFIPIKPGDIMYFSGNVFDPAFSEAHVMNTVLYDANREITVKSPMQSATDTYFETVETNEDGYITALRVKNNADTESTSYIRLSLIGSGEGLIITVNEPIVPNHHENAWVRIEKYVSEDWCQEIENTVDAVNNIELSDESAAIKFMFATDIHLDPDPSTSYTQSIGKICAEVMQSCDIPFFITGGDNCTQSSGFMPTVFKENMDSVLNQLLPIPQKNILLTVGNHDGQTGAREYNGEMVYYRYQLNNEERSAVFFDWQRESNEYKHFDSDGTYYYLDDSSTKTRYILLNSFWSQWEGDPDGFVPDIQHSFGHVPIFGPQQLKWFAEEALDMPPDYSAIIITHFAPDANDFEVFKGIVDAFSNQTIYKGSYTGVYDWQSTEITVNYQNAYGEIIAVFQGHRHTNAVYDYFDKVPCINTTTTGAFWAVRDENAEVRVKDTASEFAVDTVVIDKTARKIYIKRLGAGEDRIIDY